MSEKQYSPLRCQHKKYNGLSAWQFQSESSGSGPECNFRVCIFVCSECGEIRIGGHRWDGKSKHIDHFSEEFLIYHPNAIDAIVKSANFYNEEAKWIRAEQAQKLAEALKEIRKHSPDRSGFAKTCDQALAEWEKGGAV